MPPDSRRLFRFALLGAATITIIALGLAARPSDHAARAQRAAAAIPPTATPSGGGGAAGAPARAARPPARVSAARARLARRLGATGLVQADRRTGGVRRLARLDGFLSGPGTGGAAARALGYVRERPDVFGLDAGDLRGLHLVERERDPGGAVTRVRWQQRARGIPLVDGDLRATVARDGRIVSVSGGARPDLAEDAVKVPVIDARQARRIAARATNAGGPEPGVLDAAATGPRTTRFANGDRSSLVHTAATGELRLAWRVIREQSAEELYDQLIDARDGRELSRRQRVTHASGHVFDHYPGAPNGGVSRLVSFDGDLTPGATELRGPAARVFADLDDDGDVDPGESIPPTSGGNWNYPRIPTVGLNCPAVGCSWTPGVQSSLNINLRQSGTQLFHFLRTFRHHLAAQPIGFDGFHGTDGIDGRAYDGANWERAIPAGTTHLNNATMAVFPEGTSPTMRMYLWGSTQVPIPAVNAADDASIVYHEYSHGLTGRLVIDALGWSALGLRQSAAIDEAVADFYALDYLVGSGLVTDTPAAGEVELGAFVDPRRVNSRKQAIDCPVAAAAPGCRASGGFTYVDFGQIVGRVEQHYDGEILAETLWDLRTRVIADRGADEGVRRMRSLLTFALRELPPNPSFLDVRNALLSADTVTGGDAERIWAVFAKRGMGYFASTADGDDATPQEDFSLPPGAAGGVLSGVLADAEDGAPLANATVSLGGHDSGEFFPGDLRAKSDADGRYRIAHVPAGTYAHVTVERAGHEPRVLRGVTVGAGETARNATLRRNWAAGARIDVADGDDYAERGCGVARAFDGDRTRGWLMPAHRAHTIELTLPADVRVTSVALDPTARCRVSQSSAAATVTVRTAPASSSEWSAGVVFRTGPGSTHGVTELRPPAPLEDVRRIQVTVHDPIDPDSDWVGISELMVFATRKTPPRAAFTWNPGLADVQDLVTLDGSGSRPGSAALTTYAWDLDGDGSYERESGPTAEVSFDEGGRHTIGLRVTDAEGQTDEIRHALSIGTGYEIFDLGTLEPRDVGTAHSIGITPRGVVVGQTHPGDDDWKAFRYEGGAMQELKLLPGDDYGSALNGNDSGLSAGVSSDFGQEDGSPILWNGTEPTDLGTFGGLFGKARDVNQAGTVVGSAQDISFKQRPFIKTLGAPMRDLEELAGVPAGQRRDASALRISDTGIVVGCYGADGDDCGGDGFRYDQATHTLRTLPDLGRAASPIGVNAAGAATGWVEALDGSLKPARWDQAGTLQPLKTLGGAEGAGVAVSDDGTIYGEAETLAGARHAVRWRAGAAEPDDLNDLVKGSGWRLDSAHDVNARGEVVGWGATAEGPRRAYQLNLGPCRMCIADVALEERDLATGDWQPLGGDGTVDGNRVRARIEVRNDDDRPHIAQVRGLDENRNETIDGSGAPISLDPGETGEVTLFFDTEGLAWNTRGAPDSNHVLRFRLTLGHTVYTTRGAALKVRPKPLVLAHGMAATASAWAAWPEFATRAHPDWEVYAVGDGRVPGMLDTGSWGDLDATPATIRTNAKALAGYIAAVRTREDAEHVELVAHALGGLIARRYIQDEMPESEHPVVAHLIALGTPNTGSPCADLSGLPIQYEQRTDVTTAFNHQVTDRRGVPFSAYAGNPMPSTCESGEAGDGVVALSSAQWEISDRVAAGTPHTAMTGSGAIFSGFVKPRLSGEVEVPVANGFAATAEPEPVRPRSHQLLARRILPVAPGVPPAETVLDVDSGSRLKVQLIAAPEVSAQLVAPDGQIVATGRALTAEAPAAGAWRVRLTTSGSERSEAQVIGRLVDDRYELAARAGAAAAGGATPIVATVARDGRRLGGATVSVAVRRPGAPDVNVPLHDDGLHGDGGAADGCYAGAAAVPAGDALLTMTMAGGGGQRLRETFASIAEPAGEGVAVSCPRGFGRPGEIAFRSAPGAHESTSPRTVDLTGAEAALGGLGITDQGVAHSPDGEWVAYNAGARVVVAGADGSAPRTVIDGGADVLSRVDVAWSPDGSALAYGVRCPQGDCGIGVVDLETGTERRLASTVALAGGAPTWSPDARMLAFVGHAAAEADLYRVGADGSGLKRLTRLGHEVDEPAWSPDGERIAFSRLDTGGEDPTWEDREIYTVAPDGSALENLTRDPDCNDGGCAPDDRDSAPAWSPDGRRIAFVSNRGEPVPDSELIPQTAQVWTMRPDGSGRAKITNSRTPKSGSLSWRSLPYLADRSAPDCRNLTVRTLAGAPIEVPLDCTDPNGDVLTLEVLGLPSHGTLSPIGAGGTVTYTPASGYVGADSFGYRASDGQDRSAPATVTVDVAAPPPAEPTPAPAPHPGGGVIGGSAGGSGGSGSGGGRPRDNDGDDRPGPVVRIPGDCVTDPRTGFCIVRVGCQAGGNDSGCAGRFAEAPARAKRSPGVRAEASVRRRLLRTTAVHIPAGKTVSVRLELSKHGRAQLRRKRRVQVRVAFELRAGSKVLQRSTRLVTFKAPKRGR